MVELAAAGRSADGGKFLKAENEEGTVDASIENEVGSENRKLHNEKGKTRININLRPPTFQKKCVHFLIKLQEVYPILAISIFYEHQ